MKNSEKTLTFYLVYDLITGKPLAVLNDADSARNHLMTCQGNQVIEWMVQKVELKATKETTYPRQWVVVSNDTKSWKRRLINYLLGSQEKTSYESHENLSIRQTFSYGRA